MDFYPAIVGVDSPDRLAGPHVGQCLGDCPGQSLVALVDPHVGRFADAEVTDSGLASKVIKPGTGTVHPDAWDKVTVHYSGWTTDGKMFDSSSKRGKPATFPLTGVIKGWTEGVQLMVIGEKTRFWIPEEPLVEWN